MGAGGGCGGLPPQHSEALQWRSGQKTRKTSTAFSEHHPELDLPIDKRAVKTKDKPLLETSLELSQNNKDLPCTGKPLAL